MARLAIIVAVLVPYLAWAVVSAVEDGRHANRGEASLQSELGPPELTRMDLLKGPVENKKATSKDLLKGPVENKKVNSTTETTTIYSLAGTEMPAYPPKSSGQFAARRYLSFPDDEFATTCGDLPYTGVRFKTGEKAVCSDLVDYCANNATRIAKKVRYACMRSCGMCDIESTDWPKEKPCVDKKKEDFPVLTAGGTPMECDKLESFCEGHSHSGTVGGKCPVTCKVCVVTTPPPEVLDLPSHDPHAYWITTPAPTTTSALDPDHNKLIKTARVETQDGPIQCTRRRRWGFCYTRRRRDDSRVTGDDDE